MGLIKDCLRYSRCYRRHLQIKASTIKDKRYDGLYLLPAAQTRDKNSITPQQMVTLCEGRKKYDYKVDCPAGIEQGFRMQLPELTGP